MYIKILITIFFLIFRPTLYADKDMLHKSETTVPPNPEKNEYHQKIKWNNVIMFTYIHLAGLYGAYLMIYEAKWHTVVWCE